MMYPVHLAVRVLIVASATVVAVACTGCGRSQIRNNYTENASYSCYGVAPVVLVGTITAVRAIGPPQLARNASRPMLDPIEITVAVEHWLRGGAGGATVQIYGFRHSATVSGEIFDPLAGDLRLFPLKHDSGRLRLLFDDGMGTAPKVHTGAHPNLDKSLLKTPGKAIASIMLLPDKGCRVQENVPLPHLTAVALAVTQDTEYVTQLLHTLATCKENNQAIRKRATEEIEWVRAPRPLWQKLHETRWDATCECAGPCENVP